MRYGYHHGDLREEFWIRKPVQHNHFMRSSYATTGAIELLNSKELACQPECSKYNMLNSSVAPWPAL